MHRGPESSLGKPSPPGGRQLKMEKTLISQAADGGVVGGGEAGRGGVVRGEGLNMNADLGLGSSSVRAI